MRLKVVLLLLGIQVLLSRALVTPRENSDERDRGEDNTDNSRILESIANVFLGEQNQQKSSPQPEGDEIFIQNQPVTPPYITNSSTLETTNSGNEFYIGFMENYIKPAFVNNDRLVLNRSQIFITTPESIGAVAVIESEQGRSMINVRPGEIMTRTFEDFKVTSGTDRRKGIKIKAEQLKQISVFALNEELHSTDAFTALPCTHLPSVTSYEYYAISVPAASPNAILKSAFLVVACSDNTVVSITPTLSVAHPYIPNFKVRAGTTFNVRLNERETLYVRDSQDLTGTKVVSNNPISFFTGHECGNVPAHTPECDHLVEQIPPTVTWGTQFILAPTITRESPDLIRIVASKDNTSGVISCAYSGSDDALPNSKFSLTQAGNVMDFNISTNSFCYLETDRPVMTVQFTAGGGADNSLHGAPFMVIVPAVQQYLELTTFSTISGHNFKHYVNMFVPAQTDVSGIVIDNQHQGNEWIEIPCPDLSQTCGYAKQVSISDGVHSVWNSKGGRVGVTVYGFSFLESYAFVGGLKLDLPGDHRILLPKLRIAIPGSTVCIQCHSTKAELSSIPTRTWTVRGEIIMYQRQSRMFLSPSGSLCIMNILYSDAGNYVCHLPKEGARRTTMIEVAGGIIAEKSCKIPEFDSPSIGIGQETVFLESTTKSFGICCRTLGPPGYRTRWLKNGEPLKNEQGYIFGDGYLKYSGSLHTGCAKFSCEMELTAHGLRREETTKICIGAIQPPTSVHITGEKAVLENANATYQCTANGSPKPTKIWSAYNEGQSILPTTARDDGSGKLTVQVTESDASRRYCCDVTNDHGQITKCFQINVLIPPAIIMEEGAPFVTVKVPYGVKWPLEIPLSAAIPIGKNVMIPEGYQLVIECKTQRANPQPKIIWHIGDNLIQGPQYTVKENGTLTINGIKKGRDEGVYTCIADTPNVGQDKSSSTVIVTIPPKINDSSQLTSPGNCLDLTKSLVNIKPVGVDLCLRAGVGANLTLDCKIVEGAPAPSIEWLKDGVVINRHGSRERVMDDRLVISLPHNASTWDKLTYEGNYTCHAFNVAGSTRMETHITLFGDLHTKHIEEFQSHYAEMYDQLRMTVLEHFPGVAEGEQHLAFLTTGRVLAYDDYDPGYLYDESEESVLPQTMENMFDLVDIIPDGGSIVFNPHRAPRLQQTYSQLVDMLQSAPSSLSSDDYTSTRKFFQEIVEDPSNGQTLPRLSLYLRYKDMYYAAKKEVEDLIESQRQRLLSWEFTRWHEHNIHSLQMKINDAFSKWEVYGDKLEVERKLETLNLEDHSEEIHKAQAMLLSSQRTSRFKDEKQFYLVKFYPVRWYKGLRNEIEESIIQMQYQLSKLKTAVKMLQLTKDYMVKKSRERENVRKFLPTLDPVYKLNRDLDHANSKLQELVKETEDKRLDCLIKGNTAECNLYWDMYEHVSKQVMENYTEFYWYVHTVEAALNYREFSIPVISGLISKMHQQMIHIQASIDIAISETTDTPEAERNEDGDGQDFFTNFVYMQNHSNGSSGYDFDLPSSLKGRMMWYINPESTRLVPKELVEEYNLTINHLNTAFTNVSAKLSRVNVHRRWFKAGLFGNKHLNLAESTLSVSPGKFTEPLQFRQILKRGSYQLPLYPSTLLLATDIVLTVDVPYIFHTLPTLIKLSYDPHVTGGFGPFSFGPLHKANAGNMKFSVTNINNKLSISLPGTQLIGYICDIVPPHPRQTVNRSHRSSTSTTQRHDTHLKEKDFDQWLFSRKNKDPNIALFNKNPYQTGQPSHSSIFTESTDEEKTPIRITPTAPLHHVYQNTTF